MRRFILLVLASLMFISSSYADLGDIKVNSYLSQRFNATVLLTNMPKDTDYNNLDLGLASGAKFREYGIDFNPELGSFTFQVVTNAKVPYVKITSTKPLNSPVLNFLLHYRLNKNDFYRQYTVLLDPIDYSSATQQAKADNKLIVVRNNQDSNRVIPNEKPIPVYPRQYANVNIEKPSFQIDLSNPELQSVLAHFNLESMSYTTVENDSLYAIAKFNQSIYPKAQLTISQVLIALGIENYHQMHNSEFLYESNVTIKIPVAKKISLIPANLADEYLLDVSLTNDQKFGVLKAIANKYNSSIIIESAELFIAKTPVKKVPAGNLNSSHEIKTHHNLNPAITKPVESPLLSILMDKLFYLLGVLIILLLLILIKRRYPDIQISKILKRFRRKSSQIVPQSEKDTNYDSKIYGDLNKFSHHRTLSRQQFDALDEQQIEPALTENNQSSAAVATPEINSAEQKESEPTSAKNQEVSKVSKKEETLVDYELLETLEKILLMDSSRDDIRYKLFELYILAGKIDKASQIFYALDHRLEIEDTLRHSIELICQRYDFTPISESELADVLEESPLSDVSKIKDLPEINNDQGMGLDPLFEPITHPGVEVAETLDESSHVVDFISFTPTQSTPEPDEVISFSEERMLDFSIVDFKPAAEVAADYSDEKHSISISSDIPISDLIPEDPASVIVTEDNSFDEKLNLARMYFHIEESDKAKDIINQLLENPGLSEELKNEINKLKVEMGVNG